jgi:hypothetical protein
VGDDVVQLTRDPRALLSDCDAGRRVALALGICGAFFRRLGLHHPLTQCETGKPGDREQDRGEYEVARRVGRVVVDNDRRAAQHDGQPDTRLNDVTQVAQQKRREHSGNEDTRPAEQPPVEE